MAIPETPGRIPDLSPLLPPATSAPLDLPRLVMRRAAWVAAAGVLLMLLLGLARVRDNVDDELAGARPLAELSERLSTLDRMDDAQARQALLAWARGTPPRHLRVRVVDSQGVLVMQAGPQPALLGPTGWLARLGDGLFAPAEPYAVAWSLPRPEGLPWSVTLSAAPESEHLEALANLWEGVLWLAAVAAGLLLVMAWNSRRAFAPLAALLAAIRDLEAPAGSGQLPRMRALPAMPIAELDTLASALRHLDEALATAQAQRQHLARQLLSLQEEERTRLARELHDEFGQRLTALRVNATWLGRRCAADPELLPVVQDMAGQCQQIQQDIRALLARLHPLPSRDEARSPGWTPLADLAEALRQLVNGWSGGRPDGLQVHLALQWQAENGPVEPDWHQAPPGLQLQAGAALALYRISQEALTNVARHAQARQARLRLSARRAGGASSSTHLLELTWSVEDDGVGLADAPAAFRRGNGLAGLQERLWSLAGELRVGSPAEGGPGCALSARLQLPCQLEEVSP